MALARGRAHVTARGRRNALRAPGHRSSRRRRGPPQRHGPSRIRPPHTARSAAAKRSPDRIRTCRSSVGRRPRAAGRSLAARLNDYTTSMIGADRLALRARLRALVQTSSCRRNRAAPSFALARPCPPRLHRPLPPDSVPPCGPSPRATAASRAVMDRAIEAMIHDLLHQSRPRYPLHAYPTDIAATRKPLPNSLHAGLQLTFQPLDRRRSTTRLGGRRRGLCWQRAARSVMPSSASSSAALSAVTCGWHG